MTIPGSIGSALRRRWVKILAVVIVICCVVPAGAAYGAGVLKNSATVTRIPLPSSAAAPQYGVLLADPSLAAEDYAGGVRLAMMQIDWTQWEPSAGEISSAYQTKELGILDQYRQLGYTVGVNLSLNLAPAWALATTNGQLVDQFGHASGTLNFEFSAAVQALAAVYINSVVATLGQVSYYTLGASLTSEAIYPTTTTNQWWAFDSLAQGSGSGLPAGVAANPMPGWIPGTSTWDGATVTQTQVQGWYNWYIGALANFIAWEKDLIDGAGYTGYFQLNWPGNGANPWVYNYRITTDLAATSHDSFGSVNAGAVYQVLLGDLPDLSGVVIDVTSVGDGSGSPPDNGCQAADASVDWQTDSSIDSWSSTRWLTYMAGQYNLPVMGESTGSNSAAQMATDFSLVKSCGLIAFQWAFDSQLYSGQYATLANFAAQINQTPPGNGSPVVIAMNTTDGGVGTTVTLSGSGFSGATAVKFGSTPAASFTVVNDSTITTTSPDVTGRQDVTVTNPDGTSAVTAYNGFTGYDVPAMSAVSPTSGSPSGGTTVTVTGSNLTGTSAVFFGSTAAQSFTVVSSTKLTAVSPAGGGAHNISVVNPAGTSATVPGDTFTWYVLPVVTDVDASAGPSAGGTAVTVSGSGFTGATGVMFGSTPAASFSVTNDGVIKAVTPGGLNWQNLTVTGPVGTSAVSSADGFTGYNAPAVSAVSPSTGPPAGGTTVTVSGVNFTGASAVYFGGSLATSFTVVSSTQLTAVSPAGSGAHNISVVNPGGTSAVVAADTFTWFALPVVSGVAASGGPSAGGTTVTVSGSGFTGATGVMFASAPATSFSVTNDGVIKAVSPGGLGRQNVTVTGPVGKSAVSSGDGFTGYNAPALSGISPSSGPPSGGTTVTITGINFSGATVVYFGGTPATRFTVVSSTQVTAVSPAGTASHNISVANPGGTSAAVAADMFTW